jgi:hypothetical protein
MEINIVDQGILYSPKNSIFGLSIVNIGECQEIKTISIDPLTGEVTKTIIIELPDVNFWKVKTFKLIFNIGCNHLYKYKLIVLASRMDELSNKIEIKAKLPFKKDVLPDVFNGPYNLVIKLEPNNKSNNNSPTVKSIIYSYDKVYLYFGNRAQLITSVIKEEFKSEFNSVAGCLNYIAKNWKSFNNSLDSSYKSHWCEGRRNLSMTEENKYLEKLWNSIYINNASNKCHCALLKFIKFYLGACDLYSHSDFLLLFDSYIVHPPMSNEDTDAIIKAQTSNNNLCLIRFSTSLPSTLVLSCKRKTRNKIVNYIFNEDDNSESIIRYLYEYHSDYFLILANGNNLHVSDLSTIL